MSISSHMGMASKNPIPKELALHRLFMSVDEIKRRNANERIFKEEVAAKKKRDEFDRRLRFDINNPTFNKRKYDNRYSTFHGSGLI